eukprot:2957251-Rhodomonas_salina.7
MPGIHQAGDASPVSIDASVYTTIEFVSYVFLGFEIVLKSIAFGFAEKSQSFIFGFNPLSVRALRAPVRS